MSIEAKSIVIVGGTSGMGFAVAQRALAERAQVTVASSKPANVEAAVQRLPGAKGVVIDVTDEASIVAGLDSVGGFDHLAFTAGDWNVPMRANFFEAELAGARSLFDVRFWGAAAVAKHAAKRITPNGSITFTNGIAAHRPAKGAAMSAAMAGAIEFLTRSLAVELAPIRVNCVCPGRIRTGIWNAIPAEHREEQIRKLNAHQPLPRIGEPDEVAEAHLYLMRCGYTTGQILHVDGGATIV